MCRLYRVQYAVRIFGERAQKWVYGKPGNLDPDPDPDPDPAPEPAPAEINEWFKLGSMIDINRPLSHIAETKDFARLTSHPVRG